MAHRPSLGDDNGRDGRQGLVAAMNRLWALRGDLLTTAALLAVVAIMLWFMP